MEKTRAIEGRLCSVFSVNIVQGSSSANETRFAQATIASSYEVTTGTVTCVSLLLSVTEAIKRFVQPKSRFSNDIDNPKD